MLYVAYGSNMNMKQMKYRCPKSRVVGNGKIHGYRLVFNIHADIIVADDADYVPVVVWDIHDDDWYDLDMYEGFPKYYTKEIVSVEMEDTGKEVPAIVYVMTEKRKGIAPPFEDYFEVCLQGYRDHGIGAEILYDALDYAWENETEYNQYNVR